MSWCRGEEIWRGEGGGRRRTSVSTACSTFPGIPLSSEMSTSTLRGAMCVRGASGGLGQGEGRGVTPRRGGRADLAHFTTRGRASRLLASRAHLNLWLSLPRRDSALFTDLNMTAERRAEPLRARHAHPAPGPSLRDRATKKCAVGSRTTPFLHVNRRGWRRYQSSNVAERFFQKRGETPTTTKPPPRVR